MRYSIQGREVRSENAAKPTSTPSQWLLKWIADLPRHSRVLDLGCGKLRYTIPLSRQIDKVVAVDSPKQIDRVQTVDGEAGWTVRQFVADRLTNVQVFSLDEVGWRRWRYDRVLIAYVLSAIPKTSVRLDVLSNARDVLKRRGGEIFVATNFANSRYKNWETDPRATKYGDGFLIENRKGVSFYGMIPLDRLCDYCRRVGLEVVDRGTIYGNNAYVAARSSPRN